MDANNDGLKAALSHGVAEAMKTGHHSMAGGRIVILATPMGAASPHAAKPEPTPEEIEAADLAKSLSEAISADLSKMALVLPEGSIEMARVFRVHASSGFVNVSWTAPRQKGAGVSVSLRPAEIAVGHEGPTKLAFSVFLKQMAAARKGASKAYREKLGVLEMCIDKAIMNPA